MNQFLFNRIFSKNDIPNHATKSLRTHEDFFSELVFLKRFKLFFCSNVPHPRPGKRLYYMCGSGNFAQEILPTFLEQSFPRIPKNSPDCFSATYNCFYLPRLYYESNRDRIAEQSPMEVLGVQNQRRESEVYTELCQTSKMEFLRKQLTDFTC